MKEDNIVIGSENENMDFDVLYNNYRTMVYALSLKYSGNNDELAEDATQFTFMQLYRALQKGTEIKNMKSFLHTIVKNHTLNCVQKTKREVLKVTTEDEELTVLQAKDSEEAKVQSAEDTYMERERELFTSWMLQIILDELKEKNERWYTVVVEVFIRQRGQLEVGEELGMNDTAMYATIRRIRKWLKENKLRFEEYADTKTDEVPKGHLF